MSRLISKLIPLVLGGFLIFPGTLRAEKSKYLMKEYETIYKFNQVVIHGYKQVIHEFSPDGSEKNRMTLGYIYIPGKEFDPGILFHLSTKYVLRDGIDIIKWEFDYLTGEVEVKINGR